MGWRDFKSNSTVELMEKKESITPKPELIPPKGDSENPSQEFKEQKLDALALLDLETAEDGLNKTNPIHLEKATDLYKSRGWIQVFSSYLNQSIYFTRNKWVKVPDSSLPKYTRHEIEALNGLSWEETQTLHEAKVLFKGEIL
jgi:hypothetical protein